MKPLAAILHDNAHRGWHEWTPDGTNCPDGKADADAWVRKAAELRSALTNEGIFFVTLETLTQAMRSLSGAPIACRLELPEHADEWAPAILTVMAQP